MSQVLVGCDPEVFVQQAGKFVSAHGMIPGTKYDPHKVEKGAVQVDGMALEFNIDPAVSEEEFVGNVTQVLDTLKMMVPEYNVVAVPTADFSLEYIASQPREARELGCEPDFNAWTGMTNQKPNANLPMRTASGHVHVGWTKDADIFDSQHQAQARAAGCTLDLFLGVPSLFYDDDQKRRQMYGKAGCIRYKPYGVEYRTLSNAWLSSKERMAWVFRQTQKAMDLLMAGELPYQAVPNLEHVINTGDKKAAEQIVKQFNLELVQ